MPTTAARPAGLLDIESLDRSEIEAILARARFFQPGQGETFRRLDSLRGKTIVNLFFEASTRTRVSFEIAAKRLGADTVSIAAQGSSVSKGESLVDTLNTLVAMRPNAIVMRHAASGAPRFLARHLQIPIVNAGDGTHEHPTQALLDTFTVREKKGKIAGLHVAILGDILFSRVARSNIHALLKLGARVTLCGPPTLIPRSLEALGVNITHDLDSLLPEVDVVNLLRIQHERQRKEYFPSLGEYTAFFGLTKARAERLKPDCLIMHPGPINRGVEIDSDIADSGRSVILEQVTNGLATRMAVLFLCAGAR